MALRPLDPSESKPVEKQTTSIPKPPKPPKPPRKRWELK